MNTFIDAAVSITARNPLRRLATAILLIATGFVTTSIVSVVHAEQNTSRIVGGDDYNIAVAPSTVLLFNPRRSTDPGQSRFCGGTVIAERWVLTAAHCVVNSENGSATITSPDQINVLANTTRLSQPQSAPVEVVRVIPHPEYVDVRFGNDLALLELAGSTGAPITPLDSAPIRLNDAAFVAGWGALGESQNGTPQQFPDILQGVVVFMAPPSDCDQIYPQQQLQSQVSLSPDQVCAAVDGGGKDSCQGDSGGPLYRLNSNNEPATLVGVVSFGFGCARAQFPGVYAGVATQTAFINGTINGSNPVTPTTNPPNPTPSNNGTGGEDDDLSVFGDGSGCSIGTGSIGTRKGSIDPLLPLLLLLSITFLLRRRVVLQRAKSAAASRLRNQRS